MKVRCAPAILLISAPLAAACGPHHDAADTPPSAPAASAPELAPTLAPPVAAPGAASTLAPAALPAGVAASSEPSDRPPPKRRYALAAIGDSLTDPRSHGGIYLQVLAEKCPKSRFESFGVGGNMANMMRRRFLRDVFGDEAPPVARRERPAWSHVLILGGLGDVLSNLTARRTAAAIERDLAWMVETARTRGAKAIVLTLPPWAGSNPYDGTRAQMARDVNAWITAEGAAGRIDATFDTRPVLSCGELERLCPGLGAPDALHWSEAGQRRVGEALFAALFSDCE